LHLYMLIIMLKTLLKFNAVVLFTTALMIIGGTANAQEKIKRIGNKPRSGSSNSSFSVVKGNQIGIKMDAGKKPVQLLTFNFDADSQNRDSLKFKINVYEYDVSVGENFVKQDIIGVIPRGKSRISIDLAPYNIQVKGKLMAAIEWLQTDNGANPYFSIGLFNGGTYFFEKNKWQKLPIAGVDFNFQVKQLSK
jgi:hypothetical protein